MALRPMKVLFVDTAGWMACADASDPFHRRAVAARDSWLEGGGLFVTSDYVVDETLTLLRIRLGIDAAEAWWRQVDGNSRVRWEYINLARAGASRPHHQFQSAWEGTIGVGMARRPPLPPNRTG